MGKRLVSRAGHHAGDSLLTALERAEKRVFAISFLVVKVTSVSALLAALILIEFGVIRRIWETEFRAEVRNSFVPALFQDAARVERTLDCSEGSRSQPLRSDQ